MWWGGFSETRVYVEDGRKVGLNPHVVGRFFRAQDPGQAGKSQTS